MPIHRPPLQARHDRDGNFAFMLVLSLPVLLGMAAVAVDLGYQKVVRAELQATADIAAAAGTEYLDGTAAGLDAAKAAAIRAAARNHADGKPVELNEMNIGFGHWDRQSFEYVPSTDPAEIDAMQVLVRREDVPATFASIVFTDQDIAAQGRSTATVPPDSPAGGETCYLPLGVADCLFDEYTPQELTEMVFVLNPAGIDNVGWARLGASPNADWLRDQIRDCEHGGLARVGDAIGLQNGVVNSAMMELADAVEDSDTSWNTDDWGEIPEQSSNSSVAKSAYGNTYEGVIFVFDGGPEYCQDGGGSFNGTETIVGFAWAEVFDVATKGSSSSKNIYLRLDPMAEAEVGDMRGGLVDAGVFFDEPVKIVQ